MVFQQSGAQRWLHIPLVLAINTSACYLHCQASLEVIHEAVHSFQQLSYNMKAHNNLKLVTQPPQSLADSHRMSYYQYFPFKGPLSICHHLYCSSTLHHTPYTPKILYFKFIFSLSNLFHSFSHLIKFHYFTATL